jgi:hypothetical protein
VAKHNKVFGYYTTLAIVVANMVGIGVFTTLGLLLNHVFLSTIPIADLSGEV